MRKTKPRGWKKRTNKQGPGLAPNTRKREICDIFCPFSELTRAYTRVKTLTKPLAMLTCLLALVNPDSVGQQVLAVVFLTCVLSYLPCFRLLTTSICSTNCLCLLWDLPSLIHFRSRGRSRIQALCVGFAPKQTKGFSDWHSHTPTL